MNNIINKLIDKINFDGFENFFDRYYSEYMGEVESVIEEDGVIKYEVFVFAIDPRQSLANYAIYDTPYAGDGFGYQFPLRVGDRCWVSFDHGDKNFPKIVNCTWGKNEKPEQLNSNKKIGLVSRDGHYDVLDEDTKEWKREMSSGSYLSFKDKDVEISSKENMVFDSQGNLNITVKEMINAQVEKDVEITTLTNCKIDAMKTTLVVADMLELGAEGAAFSAVKFETLYAYLNTAMGLIKFHLHLSPFLGLPTSVMVVGPTLPTQDFKSEKVKLT